MLDCGSGEALHADIIAAAAGELLLCDGAPGVRAGIEGLFATNPQIRVLAPPEVARLSEHFLAPGQNTREPPPRCSRPGDRIRDEPELPIDVPAYLSADRVTGFTFNEAAFYRSIRHCGPSLLP